MSNLVGNGPLKGVRVIDLAGLPGAYGTMMLAGLGADVVKVEPPGGDRIRRLGPFLDRVDVPENSLWWAYLGQGKRSVVIDWTTTAGQAQLRELMTNADVVMDSAAYGTWEALGLGPGQLAAENPSLVWVAISPFGRSGPRRDWKGSDLIAWAGSGVLYTTGFVDRPPVAPAGPVQLACHLAAMNAAAGVLLALRARRINDGKGQLVDISMQECVLGIAPETGAPVSLDDRVHRPRGGNRRDLTRPFGLYPCKDGYVSFLVLQPGHWQAMARWIHEGTGNDVFLDETFNDLAVRREVSDFVDEFVEALTMPATKLELFREAQRRGVPCTPVNTIADLLEDPHLAATGFFQTADHPKIGSYIRPGAPFRDNHGWWSLSRAPLLGEHTEEVLSGQ